eukprot:TRINITY_DN2524_c3_g1_i1.p1 TRINITY_DN2524_c3_g1~~TRINITY_DN2524_c3_g1_i1.p1  ORF type:complete len:265 (+),score=79.91 TRINITY_DN2524_c3_g1_i1:62-796(+)
MPDYTIFVRDLVGVHAIDVTETSTVAQVRDAYVDQVGHCEGHHTRCMFRGESLNAADFLADLGIGPECTIEMVVGPDMSPEFMDACRQGDVDTLQRMLDEGAWANACDDGGRTALHIAAGKGNLDVVELLLSCGATASARDGHGRTPLHWTAFPMTSVTMRMHAGASMKQTAEALIAAKGLTGKETDHSGDTAAGVARRFLLPTDLFTVLAEAAGESTAVPEAHQRGYNPRPAVEKQQKGCCVQ